MRVTSRINPRAFKEINEITKDCLLETADALQSDVQQSQTMPFDTGELQNRSFSKDLSKWNQGQITIANDKPYARRLYHHPEYNFKKDKNKKAGGKWFEPYISGKKKNFASKAFARFMKGKM